MSDEPAQQSDSLTEQIHEAQDRGDQATAQRLFDKRNARDGNETFEEEAEHNRLYGTADEGEDGEDAEAAPVWEPGRVDPLEAVDVETVEGISQVLAQSPEGQTLADEWGGAQSREFESNIGYAKSAADYFEREAPGTAEILGTPLWNPETEQWVVIGNHPAAVKAFAKFGRMLHHGDGLEPVTVPNRARPARQTAQAKGAQSMTATERMQTLTEQIHLALGRGDKIAATRLDKERARLTERMTGNEPIVGSQGRTL